jgi:hypothetical protein
MINFRELADLDDDHLRLAVHPALCIGHAAAGDLTEVICTRHSALGEVC